MHSTVQCRGVHTAVDVECAEVEEGPERPPEKYTEQDDKETELAIGQDLPDLGDLYSRSAREDALTAAVALAIIVAIVAYLREPRPWLPSVMAALLAVSFAVKESTYLFVFMLATFLLTAVAAQAWREARRLEPELPNRDVTWPCLSALTMLGAFIVAGNWFDSVFVLLVLYGLVLIGVALVFTRAALARGATLTDIP